MGDPKYKERQHYKSEPVVLSVSSSSYERSPDGTAAVNRREIRLAAALGRKALREESRRLKKINEHRKAHGLPLLDKLPPERPDAAK